MRSSRLPALFLVFLPFFLFIFVNAIANLFVDESLHKKDFQTVKQFLRIQGGMEIVNSVGNAGASVLSGFLETKYPFLLSVIFIFALNSILSLVSYVGLQYDAPSLYAIQILGLIGNTIGILNRWQQQEEELNPPEIFDVPTVIYRAKTTLFCESPRRHRTEMEALLPKP